jgi:hypothetical protein
MAKSAKAGGPPREETGPSPQGPGPVCPVALCPGGMFLTVTEELRPEVVEHLLKAGRELMLATRAFLDNRLEGPEEGGPPLEKIEVE